MYKEIMIKSDRVFQKELFFLTLPIVLQNLLSTTISSVDVMMLSYVSQNSLSAVSLAGQVQFVLNLFFQGLMTGTVTICAQYWGKRDRQTVEKTALLALRFSLLISGMFSLMAILFPGHLMLIFTDIPELAEEGSVYLRIIGISYLFMGITEVYLGVLKSVGQVRRSTVFASATLLLNVCLNAVFIFGWFGIPKLGVPGVACATVCARFAELMMCVIDAFWRKKIRFTGKTFGEYGELKTKFLKISLPVMAEGMAWGGANAVLSMISGHLGSDMVAASSVASVIQSIAVVICFGLAAGGTILLGQDLGQGHFEKAQSHAETLIRGAFFSGCIGGIGMFASYPLILRMVSLSGLAVRYLQVMFGILSVNVILAALTNMMICGIFCAGGDTRFGLFCDIVVMWGCSVLPGLLLGFVFHAPPILVYVFMHLDEAIKLPFVIYHYRKKRWMKNITIEEKGGMLS